MFEKPARVVHDLALALLTGGIAGIGVAVTIVFARSPSREIAGQIGTAVFDRLGTLVLVLSVALVASRLVLRAGEPPGWGRGLRLVLSVAILAISAAIALWLTPRMSAIWALGTHAADGSGLEGESRRAFLMLHGMGNLAYLLNFILGLVLISIAAPARK